jgi:hypothetical protein
MYIVGTILNTLFETNFEIMSGKKQQTTRGIWLSGASEKAVSGIPPILVMDTEGLDGRESEGKGGVCLYILFFFFNC